MTSDRRAMITSCGTRLGEALAALRVVREERQDVIWSPACPARWGRSIAVDDSRAAGGRGARQINHFDSIVPFSGGGPQVEEGGMPLACPIATDIDEYFMRGAPGFVRSCHGLSAQLYGRAVLRKINRHVEYWG